MLECVGITKLKSLINHQFDPPLHEFHFTLFDQLPLMITYDKIKIYNI